VPCVASDVSARPEGTVLFRGGDVGHLVEQLVAATTHHAPATHSPDAAPVLRALYDELWTGARKRTEAPPIAA
jgi:glycogen synthase